MGTYTAGKDDMTTYYAVPCTWRPGGFQESDYSDEGGFSYGSSVTLIDGTSLYLKEGTMEIKGNLVKIDMKDEQGNEYKYAYDGEYNLNITASFGGSSDPTEDIYKVSCGVIDEADGVSNMCLTIYAGDPTAPTRSLIYFNIATPEDGVYNIAGTYSNPETPEDAGKVGTADLGYYVEFGDFKMAMGSSVIDADFNMWAADGMVILMVVPNEDGTYMIMARLADAEAVAAAESEEEAGISYLYMIMSTTIDMESEEADD